jgi:hypothetical protein
MLWYGAGVPALASALVLAASWPLRRRTAVPRADSGPQALALGIGYAAGHVGIEGWRPFPPREAADWLWYLTFAAVVLSLCDTRRSCPAWLRWGLRSLLWLAVVWVLLPPAVRKEAGRGVLLTWLAGLGLAGMLFWAVLSITARRLPGALPPLVLLITSAGTVAVLSFGHSFKLTQLAGALTAALLPILLGSGLKPPLVMATAPVTVLLPGLWLLSHFYDDEPPPVTSFLLLGAAALTGALGLLPGVRNLAAWQRGLLCGLAACLLVAWAVWAAQGVRSENADFVLSY